MTIDAADFGLCMVGAVYALIAVRARKVLIRQADRERDPLLPGSGLILGLVWPVVAFAAGVLVVVADGVWKGFELKNDELGAARRGFNRGKEIVGD